MPEHATMPHGLRALAFAALLVLPVAGPPPRQALSAPSAAAQWLSPFAVPGGGIIHAEPALHPALAILAGLDVGPALLAALAHDDVFVEFDDLDEWAHYSPPARAIRIDATLENADPRSLAALLAHEASHARADLDGTTRAEQRSLGAVEACVEGEHRATLTELHVWQVLFGPRGKSPPQNGYERLVNAQLAAYLASAATFRAVAPREHARQCLD
jgi:hypothetical protein